MDTNPGGLSEPGKAGVWMMTISHQTRKYLSSKQLLALLTADTPLTEGNEGNEDLFLL
jgi:hypothetical protein